MLVATALADLLPEATDLIGKDVSPILPGAAAVVGFLLFSALEAFIHRETWEHEHERSAATLAPTDVHEHPSEAKGVSPLSVVGPISLIAHSTLDGLAIGLAFRAGGQVGLLVGLAVLAHDFADGMNVVTLALARDTRVTVARVLLVLDALAPPIGAAIGTFAALDNLVLGFLLLTTVGAAVVLAVRSIAG